MGVCDGMSKSCSGLVERETKCKHGFPVDNRCRSLDKATVPMKPICESEEVCARFYENSGGKPEQPVEYSRQEAPDAR